MPTKHLDYFASLVAQDQNLPLTEAAIAVAQHAYPDLDVQAVLDHIDTLVKKLSARFTPETTDLQKLQHLKHYFFSELHFELNTNDYYDPENSYLHSVLQTRRGIPISLSLIMLEMGGQIGLNIRGISFSEPLLGSSFIASR